MQEQKTAGRYGKWDTSFLYELLSNTNLYQTNTRQIQYRSSYWCHYNKYSSIGFDNLKFTTCLLDSEETKCTLQQKNYFNNFHLIYYNKCDTLPEWQTSNAILNFLRLSYAVVCNVCGLGKAEIVFHPPECLIKEVSLMRGLAPIVSLVLSI